MFRQQDKVTVPASKDQMRMRLGAMPDMVSSADQAMWSAGVGAAQDDVAVAMDKYHQLRDPDNLLITVDPTCCFCHVARVLPAGYGNGVGAAQDGVAVAMDN
jgi:hypothetical protein